MRPVRLLVILLVVATLLVDLVVVSAVASHQIVPDGRPHLALDALFTLCMAQVGLVAIGTGFGGKSLPWRSLALILTIGLWSRLVAWSDDVFDDGSLVNGCTCVLVAQSILMLVLLGALRFRGMRLVRASDKHPSQPLAPGRRPFQFSLGYLLSWITVLGVVLGLAQYTLEFDLIMEHLRVNRWVLPVAAVSHAGLVLAGLWAVFGGARLWARALVVVLIAAAANVACHRCSPPGSRDLLRYTGLCLLQVFWVVASLSVFRVAGYRITRRAGVGQDERASSPDVA